MNWCYSTGIRSWPGELYAASVPLTSTVIVPPPVEPLTLDEVKLFHRIDHNLEDAMLSVLIQAAREYCEGWAGQSLVTQTREVSVAVYVEGMRLPFGPVQSVTAPPETSAPYTVQYVAGYPPVEGSDPIDYTGNIPASYKAAMQLLIGDWYENRENTVVGTTTGPLQIAVHQLLSWYRERRGFA